MCIKTNKHDDSVTDSSDPARDRDPTQRELIAGLREIDIEWVPVQGAEPVLGRGPATMQTLPLSPRTAAIIASSTTAYCKYAVLADGIILSFAISLCDPTVVSVRTLAMRHMGAEAFGQVSVFGVPEGDPEPFRWAYRGDGGIGFLVKPNSVGADIKAISFEMLKTFFADIADVAPDLALLDITGYGPQVPLEILARARAELPGRPWRGGDTIH